MNGRLPEAIYGMQTRKRGVEQHFRVVSQAIQGHMRPASRRAAKKGYPEIAGFLPTSPKAAYVTPGGREADPCSLCR